MGRPSRPAGQTTQAIQARLRRLPPGYALRILGLPHHLYQTLYWAKWLNGYEVRKAGDSVVIIPPEEHACD